MQNGGKHQNDQYHKQIWKKLLQTVVCIENIVKLMLPSLANQEGRSDSKIEISIFPKPNPFFLNFTLHIFKKRVMNPGGAPTARDFFRLI